MGSSSFLRIGTSLLFLATASIALPTQAWTDESTHQESKQVVVRGEQNQTLQTFCLGPDGRLFALVASPVIYGADEKLQAPAGGEVRVLDRDGKELTKWSLDFAPQRIAAAPDGEIFIGGGGQLARFTADGKLFAKSESPHLASVLGDKEALRTAAEEQHKSSLESYEQQLKQFSEQIKQLEANVKAEKEAAEKAEKNDKAAGKQPAKPAQAAKNTGVAAALLGALGFSSATPDVVAPGAEVDPTNPFGGGAEQQLRSYRQIVESYQQMLAAEKKKTIDDVVKEITARLQRVHGIAASKDELFVATAMSKGYGYAVWRMTRDFRDAKQVVSGLSGCCGQIDVQCRDGKLFVAENSRHRVVSYDREGKRLESWGKRDREGEGAGFGGCCNPMNLCFLGDGSVVTSESEGLVKCFSPAGDFVGLLGKTKVSGGCKNVAVAVSPDGKQVYFYDLQGSKIIILERRESSEKPAAPKKTEVSRR